MAVQVGSHLVWSSIWLGFILALLHRFPEHLLETGQMSCFERELGGICSRDQMILHAHLCNQGLF